MATDYPGNWPNVGETIQRLVAVGCDVNAPCVGPHCEAPLHWAAGCDDVAAIDALVLSGADIEQPGAVIGGLTPLANAVAFGQWRAAFRLVEHGAVVNFWQAAGLGMADLVSEGMAAQDEQARTHALWSASHGGRQNTAALLLEAGADPTWVGHDGMTCREIAEREGLEDFVAWLDARLG